MKEWSCWVLLFSEVALCSLSLLSFFLSFLLSLHLNSRITRISLLVSTDLCYSIRERVSEGVGERESRTSNDLLLYVQLLCLSKRDRERKVKRGLCKGQLNFNRKKKKRKESIRGGALKQCT